MKLFLKAFLRLATVFFALILCFFVGKCLFLLINWELYKNIGLNNFFKIITHGLSMDLSVAGYFSVIPGIIQIISLFEGYTGCLIKVQRWYFCFVSLIISLVLVIDSSLYGYWQFKLDSTPLFYFFSSPSSAFASVTWMQLVAFPVVWVLLFILFYIILSFSSKLFIESQRVRGKKAVVPVFCMVIVTGALFIPIRGGVTVSTMNLSRSYFSSEKTLNHAAVNPVFSLLYSLTHQSDFASQFRYFTDEVAEKNFSKFLEENKLNLNDTTTSVLSLNNNRPDIYIIILESFSSHLFPSLGGEEIAIRLDSIGREGLMFSNFYANSFRTDRGIPSILSAYPGQPTTSVMKFTDKVENLPSIASVLKNNGKYSTSYYYGGDINFTNLNAYLVSAGFDHITSDVDFPLSERLSKWGAHDEVLFRRVIEEIKPYDANHPRFNVIQTSSSHEPFIVPYDSKGRLSNPRANAFAYADSCAAEFINALKESDNWSNSLIIGVPDHYGAYPSLESTFDRHKIPLIITGGALSNNGLVDVYGSQVDIAATLLKSLGLPTTDFKFSHNLFDESAPHFAFFADADVIGMVNEGDSVLINLDNNKLVCGKDSLANLARTYLQVLYKDLSER